MYAQTYFSGILEEFNNHTIEYVSIEDLNSMGKTLLLNARKKEEFDINHLKNVCFQ